jgi:hypothetical protein
MSTESLYLDTLQDPELYLDSPLPLEVSGQTGNFVASWMETKIEGEGPTRDAAVDDARKQILTRYRVIEKKLKAGEKLREADETIWISMCHYIANISRGRIRPGEEYQMGSPSDPDYKGPVFG